MKLWSGRFKETTSQLMDAYQASIKFDYLLAPFDIQGSLAHIAMLEKCQLITSNERQLMKKGLLTILDHYRKGKLSFELADEDIHMCIEKKLFTEIGETAGKLHMGRSRNDQVALDLHLYLRSAVIQVIELLKNLMETLFFLANDHIDTLLPGYTHLQRAEPIRLAHHLLAYVEMLNRDSHRLLDSFSRINLSPLGAGALAGSGLPIDREYLAQLLKFDGIYENSMDAVSDRDFIIEFLSNASLIMMHLSRLSEELILWNSQEFNFIEFADQFCTGSSMMPQKKNPDVCELARGKTGRVYGSLISLLTTLKGLPLAYNKDMQEDKEGLFDTVNTLTSTLSIYAPLLSTLKVNKDKMFAASLQDYANATLLANYLTQKGLPFRGAHEIVGKIVAYAIEENLLLNELPLKKYHQFSPLFDEEIYLLLTPESVVESHCVRGGTAKQSVQHQITLSQKQLKKIDAWLEKHLPLLEWIDV